MKTKTPKNNTSKWSVSRKITCVSNLLRGVLNLNHLTIIRAWFYNKNNKLKRLVQWMNDKKGEKTWKTLLDNKLSHPYSDYQ